MPAHTPLSPKKAMAQFIQKITGQLKEKNKTLFSVRPVSRLPVPESLNYVIDVWIECVLFWRILFFSKNSLWFPPSILQISGRRRLLLSHMHLICGLIQEGDSINIFWLIDLFASIYVLLLVCLVSLCMCLSRQPAIMWSGCSVSMLTTSWLITTKREYKFHHENEVIGLNLFLLTTTCNFHHKLPSAIVKPVQHLNLTAYAQLIKREGLLKKETNNGSVYLKKKSYNSISESVCGTYNNLKHSVVGV